MKTKTVIYPIYDLANKHFNKVEIITNDDKILKGQFVRFKVIKGFVENIYPAEKYCFLPAENEKEFRNAYKINGGEFKEMPEYILQFSLIKIAKIIIEPTLVL